MFYYTVTDGEVEQTRCTLRKDSPGWDVDTKVCEEWGPNKVIMIDADSPVKLGETSYLPLSRSIFEATELVQLRWSLDQRKKGLPHPILMVKFHNHKLDKYKTLRRLDIRSLFTSNQVLFDKHHIYYPIMKLSLVQ